MSSNGLASITAAASPRSSAAVAADAAGQWRRPRLTTGARRGPPTVVVCVGDSSAASLTFNWPSGHNRVLPAVDSVTPPSNVFTVTAARGGRMPACDDAPAVAVMSRHVDHRDCVTRSRAPTLRPAACPAPPAPASRFRGVADSASTSAQPRLGRGARQFVKLKTHTPAPADVRRRARGRARDGRGTLASSTRTCRPSLSFARCPRCCVPQPCLLNYRLLNLHRRRPQAPSSAGIGRCRRGIRRKRSQRPSAALCPCSSQFALPAPRIGAKLHAVVAKTPAERRIAPPQPLLPRSRSRSFRSPLRAPRR